MGDIKWIKIATDIFDNKKIKMLEKMPDGDSLIIIWFKLLSLAGNINDNGSVYFTKDLAYTPQMLATVFDRPQPTVELALSTFQHFGMITVVEDLIQISNWAKYQNVEGMDKVREQARLRQQKHRATLKLEAKEPEKKHDDVTQCHVTDNVTCHVTDRDSQRDVTTRNVTDNVTVTQCHALDIDIDKDKDINIYMGNPKRKKAPAFRPPTVEEVKNYCLERNNSVDAERFVDFYASKGWYVGKNKMQDWKAAVRTWEQSYGRANQPRARNFVDLGNSFNDFEQNNYDFDELEKKLIDN